MNEKQFLTQLNNAIQKLSKDEKEDILHDYEEHFAVGKEEGKPEKEIAEALGSPEKIAKEILAMYHVAQAESKTTTGNMLRAVWAGIGLGFFNLLIVLGPFIAFVAVVISGWITAFSLLVYPLIVPVNLVIYPGTFEWSDVFLTLIASGIGIFIAIGMYYVTKAFKWIFVRYLKWNTALVKGGIKA